MSVASKPIKNIGEVGELKKNRDPNRGFKIDISGKLIIEEPKRGDNKHSDTDSDNDDIDEEKTKKTPIDDSDGDDELAENCKAKSRKRKVNYFQKRIIILLHHNNILHITNSFFEYIKIYVQMSSILTRNTTHRFNIC